MGSELLAFPCFLKNSTMAVKPGRTGALRSLHVHKLVDDRQSVISGVRSKQLQLGRSREGFLLLFFGRDARIDDSNTLRARVDLVHGASMSLHREVLPLL